MRPSYLLSILCLALVPSVSCLTFPPSLSWADEPYPSTAQKEESAVPRLELSQTSWDLGTLPRDQSRSLDLLIWNSGNAPLEVKATRSTCACLYVHFEPTVLAPSDSAVVGLEYVPDKKKGRVTKSVYIDTNDPERPQYVFRVKGTIVKGESPELTAIPRPWYAGAVLMGQTVTETLTIRNDGLSSLEIYSWRGVGVEIEPLSDKLTLEPEETTVFLMRAEGYPLVPDRQRMLVLKSNDALAGEFGIPVHLEIEEADLGAEGAEAGTETAASVRAVVFSSGGCDVCREIEETHLKGAEAAYRGRFTFEVLDIDEEHNYDLLVRVEQELNDEGNEIPVVVLGESLLGGPEQVKGELSEAIARCLRAGGCDANLLLTRLAAAGPGAEAVRVEASSPVYLAYFFKPGCKECDRVSYMLNRLESRNPDLEVRRYNSETKECSELYEAMALLLGIPDERRLIAPAVFIAGQQFLKDEITDGRLRELVAYASANPSPPIWEEAQDLRAEARDSILTRFAALGPLAVALGGLVDGVNPCAFATIIFFMSYLSFIGRKGRELIWVGIAFTFGVFITYYLVGLGVFRFIQTLEVFKIVSRILYVAMAALALVLGVLSLHDFVKFRRKKTAEVVLQLPGFLKKRIHSTIRTRSRTERYVLAAFVTGWVVSLLELACTGQVYLPTICFVTGVPELRVHALLYLLLYNVMFILPLVVIFTLAYLGTTSEQFAAAMRGHAAAIKLATAVFFFGLCGFLVSTLI